jgi:hypothetical protein
MTERGRVRGTKNPAQPPAVIPAKAGTQLAPPQRPHGSRVKPGMTSGGARCRCVFLLPRWEKVAEGRMRVVPHPPRPHTSPLVGEAGRGRATGTKPSESTRNRPFHSPPCHPLTHSPRSPIAEKHTKLSAPSTPVVFSPIPSQRRADSRPNEPRGDIGWCGGRLAPGGHLSASRGCKSCPRGPLSRPEHP